MTVAKREQCNVRGICLGSFSSLGEDRINKMLHEQEAMQQKGVCTSTHTVYTVCTQCIHSVHSGCILFLNNNK